MSILDSVQDQQTFIPERDDPKIRRARILKNPTLSRWHGVKPVHGWDNPADVQEGVDYCKAMSGLCRRSNEDLHKIEDLALYLRELGISETTAAELICAHNQPPFPKARVQLHVWIAYEERAYTEPGKRSLAMSADAGKWKAAEEDDSDDWMEGGKSVWPRPLHYDATQRNSAKLASAFFEYRPNKLIYSAGQFFTLQDNKIWRVLSDDELAAEIRLTDPPLTLDASRIWAMVGALKLACFTTAQPLDWIDQPANAPAKTDVILFSNGMLDFESGKLISHDGRYFATGLPSFRYDPKARCPLWESKVSEWLHESYIPTLQEFAGYAMTCDTSAEVFLTMIGVTRGGKSTIADVMQNLVGPGQHCSRTLNDLSGDFGLQGTVDKKLLFIPDAHNTETSRRAAVLERIKLIVGNDGVSVNRKHLPPLSVRVPMRIVLIANQLPKFLDESGALAARMLMLEFGTSFRGREDRELRSKLKAELPGIANWALEGLRRLRANGNRFTVGKKGKAAAVDANMAQSPALRFARDCLNVTGGKEYTDPDLVFKRYRDWAIEEEHLNPREIQNRTDFKASLLAALKTKGARYGQLRLAGKKPPRGWWGLSMLDTWDEEGMTWTRAK